MNIPYFTLTNDTRLTFAGSADRYHKNIAAIRLLRDVQKQERQPVSDAAESELRRLADAIYARVEWPLAQVRPP